MKKVTILSHPTQIDTIQLDELVDSEDRSEKNQKMIRNQIRMWRKLRQGTV